MDIPRYRIGNDLTVLWAICNNDGTPFDLSGKGVRLFVTNERGMTEVVPTITTDKNGSITNVILWTFLGNNQKVLGKHTLTVEIVTADDKRVIKRDISDAFNLVARSEGEESGGEANAVDSGTIYLSTKLDVYRFGNARVEIGTNGNWFIDGYDTGRTALAGEPGIVHNIYTESDLGKEFDPDSKIDTFNAHAINAINNALKRMTLEQLQDLSLADLEEYDVLAYNGNAWLNVPFRDLLNIFKGPSESSSGIGDGFWYLNEQDGKIHTDIGIVVHGNAIIEGDTSSGGEGQDTPAAGLDEQAILDLLEREKYVTEDDIEGLIPDVDLSEYAKTEDVETAISEVGEEIDSLSTLLLSMWHLDENGNLVTEKQVLIKNNLIIDGDTSSDGEGEDTPSGGISGVKVNGVTYYDDNGDGVIDLGTISGGGGTADLTNYYTKAQSDARYLALSGGQLYNASTDTPLYLIGNSADAYIGFKDTNNNFLGYYGFSQYTPTVYVGTSASYALIHSGNIGSYKAGDSALFDGRTSGEYYLSQKNGIPNGDLANLAAGSYYAASAKGDINPLPIDYCSLSVLGQSYYSQQLCMYHNATRAWLRGIYNTSSGASATEWHELAFTDSNVASATKLQTARTIWGQSFDGTRDIGGSVGYALSLEFNGVPSTAGHGGFIDFHFNGSSADYTSRIIESNNGLLAINGELFVKNGGNVGIGTDSPQHKLDVNGNIATNQYLRIKAWTGYGSGSCDMWYDGNATTLEVRSSVKVTKNLIVSGDTSSGSDIRFKDIIKDKTIKIEDIAEAPLFTFRWNDREDDTIHLGSSAQYWENIAPWLVSGSDFKSLNYATLGVAMGISLAKKAVNHEERIKVLEKEIKRLKEEMIHG